MPNKRRRCNGPQKAKDKSDAEVAQILEADVRSTPDLKAEIDLMLEKLDALQEAEKALSQADKAWFEELIKRELKQLNSGIKYEAKLNGNGAIAQGDGAMAAGAGGMIIQGDKNRAVRADTYIEKQVVESPKTDPEAEKRRKAREKYLSRLSRVCLSLPLAALGGADGDERDITLDKIYIALNTTEPRKKLEKSRKQAQENEDDIFSEFRGGADELIPALETVAAHKKLALLGDPGAGKSTFVKNLLAWQAGLLLGKLQESNGIEPELLPVLIILRDLAPHLSKLDIESLPTDQRDTELTQALWDQVQAGLGEECADFREGLGEALQSGQCLLVLDGLDEMPYELRVRVRQAVDALFKQYHLQRAIMTCRVRSYVGDTVLPNFENRTLASFDKDQIRNFIEHWYNTQCMLGKINEGQAKDRVNDLISAALEKKCGGFRAIRCS